jgi:hypothetical protein
MLKKKLVKKLEFNCKYKLWHLNFEYLFSLIGKVDGSNS